MLQVRFTYRRVRGTLFWHFRENCPMWPTQDYDEVQNAEDPPDGAFCIECAQCPNPWLLNLVKNPTESPAQESLMAFRLAFRTW
jgi:hypothetical protein